MLNTLYAYFVVLSGELEFWAKLADYRYSKDTNPCTGDMLCERRRYHKRGCLGATVRADIYVRRVMQ